MYNDARMIRSDVRETESQTVAGPVDNRINALRALAVLLLQEVESLREGLSIGPRNLNKERLNLSGEIERVEIEMIRHALILAKGNQRKAAAILGTKPPTLNAKIKRYGVEHFSALGKL